MQYWNWGFAAAGFVLLTFGGLGFVVRGGLLVRDPLVRADRRQMIRAATWILGGLAALVYGVGLGQASYVVLSAAGGEATDALAPCERAPEFGDRHTMGFHVSPVPLDVVCDTDDDARAYDTDVVPPLLTPVVGVLALAAVVGAIVGRTRWARSSPGSSDSETPDE